MFGNPEEVIQLTFDFGNTTEKAGQVTKSIQDMQAASDEAVRKAVELTQAQKAMGMVLEEVGHRQQAVATTVRETTTAHNDFGRGILNVSFAVQDFTSQLGTRGLAGALAAVQNNIPVILTGLGVGAGLAGVVSIASVGVGVLTSSLSGMSREAKDAAKALEDLDRAAEKMRAAPGKAEEKQAGEIAGFLAGQGQQLSQGIQAALTTRARSQGLAAEREQLRNFGVITETADQFVARNMPLIQRDTDKTLTRLATDPSARRFAAELAQQAPGNFPRGFAEDILSFDRDTGDTDLAAAEEFGHRAHRGMASRRGAEQRRRDRLSAEASTRAFGVEMDLQEMEAEHAYYGTAPANPPAFYGRRLPVGRLGPMAAPPGATMTPAQQRALIQQQGHENAQRLQNQTFDQVVGTMNQTVNTNQAMLTVMGKAQAALIEARNKLRQQEQQANSLLNRGRQ